MAPKATNSEKKSSAPPSRSSARLAGKPAPESKSDEKVKSAAKKRSADETTKSNPPSKKTKPASSSKKPKSAAAATKNGKKAEEKIVEEDEEDKPEEKVPEKEEKEEKAAEKEVEADKEDTPETNGVKALELGDKLPKITLQDEEGKDVDVSKLAGKKGVVIFLYPKADTPGCTTQACGFRDAFDEITALDYEIYGLSRDGPAAQKKWKEKKSLNYHLLCDPKSELIKRLGAFVQPKNTKRSHFIFEKGSGKLVDASLGVKPVDDPKKCLDFIRKHHK